jgi:ATP-binding cassette subfamily C protein PrsD
MGDRLPGNARLLSENRELAAALRACRGAFAGVGLISCIINMLYLTGSFFMLEVYDRILPSRSVPSLIGLAILAGFLFAFQGMLDLVRGRVLIRIGASLDERLNGNVFDALVRLPLLAGSKGESMQPLRELDQVRAFMSGAGPAALFDLPWMPFYLGICFLFHPVIGWTASLGGLVLVLLTALTEYLTRQPSQAAARFGSQRQVLAEASRRNAEVLGAMGMAGRISSIWSQKNAQYMASQRQTADIVGGIGSITKVIRMVLQSAVLGVGAYLVIKQEVTAGIIIASSILTARALAPVELAVANWKGFVGARQGWRRLTELFATMPGEMERTALPSPCVSLSVEGVSGTAPATQRLIVQDVSFTLKKGDGLGIIGPSASGKSSLVRMLVGVWKPARGKVRLDGAALEQWDREALGGHIGYLPQSIELFAGSVAQNISRFEVDPPAEKIIAAARSASVHELILRLPDGYETDIGENGSALSAGQRQRVALARALYGSPFLVVLDEPNSNLDAEGDAALTQALLEVRRRGGIVIVVAHRPSALAGIDTLLVMADGRRQSFGPKEEVLKSVTRPALVATAGHKVGTDIAVLR